MNELKIAMFGHKHVMSREGGVEIVVKELSTRLASLGHSVTCYDRTSKYLSNYLDIKTELERIKIVPVWTLDKKGFSAMTSSVLAAWEAAWSDVDIIHIHAEGPAATCGLIKLVNKIRNKKHRKLIVTIHGLDWNRAKWGVFASKYIKFGEKQAVKHADEIIVLSRSIQNYFKLTYDRDTVFIPNGVSSPEIRPVDAIRRLWSLEKNSYVLFVGRIVPEKGLRYLIEAWKGIKTDKKLVIAGGSFDSEAFMSELKKISKGSDVIFVGFQQGQVLEELYSNAYIYTLPSDLEGMPLSLLEAMSYGNCCLVSDIAECAEVVGDNAAFFSRGNIKDLREKLQQLLDNPKMVVSYKNKLAEYITKKFNWNDVVDKTLELYRR